MESIAFATHDRKVLHVDDDPAILNIVGKALSKRGYTVISVSEPEQTLPELVQHAARIVLLDIEMQGIDGLKLLRSIKKFDGSVQVIMLTGLVSMGTILRATRLGAEECFYKPIYNMDEVVDSVDRSYSKILRWWGALKEWQQRNSLAVNANATLNLKSDL